MTMTCAECYTLTMPFDDRPFQDREHYRECHRKFAVSADGEIVRIIDWHGDDPCADQRIVVVEAVNPPHRGISWRAKENTLTPVPRIIGALEAAAAWRAEQAAKKIAAETIEPRGPRSQRRI